MPQVTFAPSALKDLKRLRKFLRTKSPAAAKRAATAITKAVQMLERHPQGGRLADEMEPDYRELLIDFGDSGYVALYRYDGGEIVTVLALRHQKETGY